MEVNSENKKSFDGYLKDYINSYKDSQSENELKNNAVKFAIGQLIYDMAINRNYVVLHGSVMPENLKLYDVVLSVTMFTGEIDNFYVALKEEDDQVKAYRVIRGEGDINTDKIVSISINDD